MGRFKFVRARSYKDYWIINELVEQCNEEGKDGRFRWCYTYTNHVTLPHIEDDCEAKLVITKDKWPKIVGFYAYSSYSRRLDVLYVVPNRRGRHAALEMVDNFVRMFPKGSDLYVLNPCKAVRRMLNRHYAGRFRAVGTNDAGFGFLSFDEEDLTCAP
mgnify:CR=1 FL=1